MRISLSTCTSTTNQQMAWLAFSKISRGDLSISVGFRAHVFSGIIVILNTSKFTYGAIFNLVWISPLVSFPQVSWGSALEFIYPMKQTMSSQAGVNIMGAIEEFTLMVASWLIKARWREIQWFVLEFKASLFFLNSYVWCSLFEKSNKFTILKKLCTKSGVQRGPLIIF